jgi:DNA processing protein
MDVRERTAWLRLSLTPDIGPRTVRELLAAFGLPTAIFDAGFATLARVAGDAVASRLSAPMAPSVAAAVQTAERWLARSPAHRVLTLADDTYPKPLLDIPDPPPLLYAVGRVELLARPAFAIVGARSSTQQGNANASAFAEALAHAGLTIVSGLALGIDAAAHRGALKALDDGAPASTIAVVGTGIDVAYPPANQALTHAIRERGLVLSELPHGTPAVPHNFPRRNRLIAGLVRGVLVVEAALRSGSLITARLAAEGGREVFALPGSIHAPMARGCHRLIRDGAKLAESTQDILGELNLPLSFANLTAPARGAAQAATLPPPLQALLDAMGDDPATLDTLAARTGRAAGELAADLLQLELAQYVERLPGNNYQRLRY